MKIVYNVSYRGFGISEAALIMYNQKRVKHELPPVEYELDIKRDDPILVEVVEYLGEDANDVYSSLAIREIPDEFADCYKIKEKHGVEVVICKKIHLAQYLAKNVDLDSFSDIECREVLDELLHLLR